MISSRWDEADGLFASRRAQIFSLPEVAKRRKKVAHGASRGGTNHNESSPGWGERNFRRRFSAASAGAGMVSGIQPTVSPWAIICRASGALFANRRAQIFFQPGEGGFKGVVGGRPQGLSSWRNRGCDICGLLPLNLRQVIDTNLLNELRPSAACNRFDSM
jgi:hypothetical protein